MRIRFAGFDDPEPVAVADDYFASVFDRSHDELMVCRCISSEVFGTFDIISDRIPDMQPFAVDENDVSADLNRIAEFIGIAEDNLCSLDF